MDTPGLSPHIILPRRRRRKRQIGGTGDMMRAAYGYVGKDSRTLDHTTHLAERAFIRSLPIKFQKLATLHYMFHVISDLYDGPHALTNDSNGGHFSWLKNFLDIISPTNKKP
jgi:hypothetical protein